MLIQLQQDLSDKKEILFLAKYKRYLNMAPQPQSKLFNKYNLFYDFTALDRITFIKAAKYINNLS